MVSEGIHDIPPDIADLPQRPAGSIVASCGHKVGSCDDLVDVLYRSEDCDAVTGFHPCVISSSYCKACADILRETPEWLSSWAAADAWLKEAGADDDGT